MSAKYANQQPQGFKNHVQNVAIVGVAGRVGKFFTEELLKTGKHTVTAITRADSKSSVPSGVQAVKVDYDDQNSIVKALQGQDALIITIPAGPAFNGIQDKLIEAAAVANVPWVFPNEYGFPVTEKLGANMGRETFMLDSKLDTRKLIEKLGKSSWIGFANGFWYEFSLAGTIERYGFDFKERKVIFIDDGETKINTSTWPQCGRGMASLLSLKVLPDDENDKSPHLSQFANGFVNVSSFLVSQKDMFDSVLRVTSTKPEDWNITYENHKERYDSGVALMKQGNMAGFGRLLYTRAFYPHDNSNFEDKVGLHNDILGLPKEDLDEWTQVAIDMTK